MASRWRRQRRPYGPLAAVSAIVVHLALHQQIYRSFLASAAAGRSGHDDPAHRSPSIPSRHHHLHVSGGSFLARHSAGSPRSKYRTVSVPRHRRRRRRHASAPVASIRYARAVPFPVSYVRSPPPTSRSPAMPASTMRPRLHCLHRRRSDLRPARSPGCSPRRARPTPSSAPQCVAGPPARRRTGTGRRFPSAWPSPSHRDPRLGPRPDTLSPRAPRQVGRRFDLALRRTGGRGPNFFGRLAQAGGASLCARHAGPRTVPLEQHAFITRQAAASTQQAHRRRVGG